MAPAGVVAGEPLGDLQPGITTADTPRPQANHPPAASPTSLGNTPSAVTAQREERARIRSEKDIRWGGRPLAPAA